MNVCWILAYFGKWLFNWNSSLSSKEIKFIFKKWKLINIWWGKDEIILQYWPNESLCDQITKFGQLREHESLENAQSVDEKDEKVVQIYTIAPNCDRNVGNNRPKWITTKKHVE